MLQLKRGWPERFSANGTNAAKNSTVTFYKAGAYTFKATITDTADRADHQQHRQRHRQPNAIGHSGRLADECHGRQRRNVAGGSGWTTGSGMHSFDDSPGVINSGGRSCNWWTLRMTRCNTGTTTGES